MDELTLQLAPVVRHGAYRCYAKTPPIYRFNIIMLDPTREVCLHGFTQHLILAKEELRRRGIKPNQDILIKVVLLYEFDCPLHLFLGRI